MIIGQDQRTREVLENLIGSEFESELLGNPSQVLLRISREEANNEQSQFILTLVINLLMRLHPVITTIHLDVPEDVPMLAHLPKWKKDTLLETVTAIYDAVRPPSEVLIYNDASVDSEYFHITIGACASIKASGIWIGCDNWIASLSPETPLAIQDSINPVGAYVAATLAVSEAWKKILFPLQSKIKQIRIQPLENILHFSAFNYSHTDLEENPPLPAALDIKSLTAIGLGAGGGATMFTLASYAELRGDISMIDPDRVESTNLNRYVFADSYDARNKIVKVDCIRSLFVSNPKIGLEVWPLSFLDAKNGVDAKNYRWVLAEVDNRETRRQIQCETPEVLWDGAASGDGEFRIWRMSLGKTVCMCCKHPKNEDPDLEMAEQLSQCLGLDTRVWYAKITNNEAFSEDDINAMSLSNEAQKLVSHLPVVDEKYTDWFKARYCGELDLPEMDTEIPIPFAPVMAGVLLAGEIIKEHVFPDFVLKGHYWNSLTALFNQRLQPELEKPKHNCKFCSDPIYQAQYWRRWEKSRGQAPK